jgi:hypothetical protein
MVSFTIIDRQGAQTQVEAETGLADGGCAAGRL